MQKYWVTVGDSGTTRWYKDAKMTILHRVGGPAVECNNGYRNWRLNGELHRTTGPAIECVDGDKLWYLDGQQLTEAEFNERLK